MALQGSPSRLVVVSIGNSRTKFGVSDGPLVDQCRAVPNSDIDQVAGAIAALSQEAGEVPAVLASVNMPVADALEELLIPRIGTGVYRVGRDLEIPVNHTLADASTVGQDRLLNALGAFSRAKQACVVIDAGTAVTVDFVDGEGTFQGGVIAPGLTIMLKALHEYTAALPQIAFTPPDPALGPFGKDTAHAMLLGVQDAVRGLVRHVVELYAEVYSAYPQVVATGGDSQVLFEDDPIVEHLVPDLQLLGLAAACDATIRAPAAEDEEDD